jgi:hypothetical protein
MDPDSNADGGFDLGTILADYSAWQPQTTAPVNVSGYIFSLCRMPTLPEQTFAASEHGNFRYLQDWANPEAVAGIARRGNPSFSEGSIIVKEKYVPNLQGQLELVARGLMIKRGPGFDPTRADWDYAYWEPELGVLHTAEQSAYCGACHARTSGTDSVYVDGLRP